MNETPGIQDIVAAGAGRGARWVCGKVGRVDGEDG